MSSIAIIPARGGSKRIPRKNIRSFLGKPIISYSIEAAINSGCFDTVMVSTDDPGIAEVAKQAGAEVPFFRSKKNADDYATSAAVIREVLDTYKTKGQDFDSFCCLYPTAPFVTALKLEQAFQSLNTSTCHSVISVTPFSFPIQRSLKIDANGNVVFNWPEYTEVRSQDLDTRYHDCGQFYFVKTKAFNLENRLFTSMCCPVIIPETEMQDIDTESDWIIAELKYKLLNK